MRRGFREIKARARVGLPPPRASRLPAFVGHQKDNADEALATLSVCVAGVGAIGSDFAQKLARLQPRRIALIDPKNIKDTTVLTGSGFFPSDRGAKVEVIGRRLKALSPATQVLVYEGAVQDVGLVTLHDLAVDIVLLASDNLECELAVGQRCQALRIPLIHAAIAGPSLVAQIRVHSESCPACSFGSFERKQLHQQIQFSCEGNRVEVGSVPTMSTPHLCSTAANLALNQLMRWRLRLGSEVADTITEYCGFTNRMVTSPLVRNPDCLCDHTRFKLVSVSKALADCSLEEIATAAGVNGETWSAAFTGMKWVERLQCRCQQLKHVARFIPERDPSLGRCRRCGGVYKVHPQFSSGALPSAKMLDFMNLPLRRLGVGSRTPTAIIRTETTAFVLSPGKEST